MKKIVKKLKNQHSRNLSTLKKPTMQYIAMILASWMWKKYIRPIIEAYINFCQNNCDVTYLQLLYTLLPPIVTIHVHL